MTKLVEWLISPLKVIGSIIPKISLSFPRHTFALIWCKKEDHKSLDLIDRKNPAFLRKKLMIVISAWNSFTITDKCKNDFQELTNCDQALLTTYTVSFRWNIFVFLTCSFVKSVRRVMSFTKYCKNLHKFRRKYLTSLLKIKFNTTKWNSRTQK